MFFAVDIYLLFRVHKEYEGQYVVVYSDAELFILMYAYKF